MLFSWLHQTQVNIYKCMFDRQLMTVEVISIKIITSINSTNMSLVLDVQTKSTTTQRCPGLRWWFASTAPRHWRGCCTRYTRSCSTRQRSSYTRSCSLPTTQKQVNAHHHRAPSMCTTIVHHHCAPPSCTTIEHHHRTTIVHHHCTPRDRVTATIHTDRVLFTCLTDYYLRTWFCSNISILSAMFMHISCKRSLANVRSVHRLVQVLFF